MSHSVFKDFDADSENAGTRSDVADNNLIVFINKDGDVVVDPNALQDLIVNANTESKSTVSVIRLSSPTPSMELEAEKDGTSEHEKDDDDEDKDAENTDKDNEDSGSEKIDDGDSNEDDSEASSSDERDKSCKKSKKSKNKNKIPSIGLTVESFYNPEEAAEFAAQIMSIAGITNPKQLKADYDHLRHIILNDHCYTPLTITDLLAADGATENATTETAARQRDLKSKNALSKLTTTAPATATTLASNAPGPKKLGRSAQAIKTLSASERDATDSRNGRVKSTDDTSSSLENNIVESDDEEAMAEESDSDYSDFSVSESDNDRDSDLDFSVYDCHSRRTRKIKKRNLSKQQAKRTPTATKKQRRSTIDVGSDDGQTPNRKKTMAKIPKKSANTSAKAQQSLLPATTVAMAPAKGPSSQSTPRIRIPKVGGNAKEYRVEQEETTIKLPIIQQKTYGAAARVSEAATSTTITPPTTPANSNGKPKMVLLRQKEKKIIAPTDALISDVSSLFSTPDIIKKVGSAADGNRLSKMHLNVSVSNVSPAINKLSTSSGYFITLNPEAHKATTNTVRNTQPLVKLASEQDKQLDLIDSLVQEELNKTPSREMKSSTPISQSNHPKLLNAIHSDIPSIVKMLETPVSTAADLTHLHSTTSMTSPIPFSTSVIANDSQMLPDDLLESFANSDDCLTDDLMQHVAKLVEDKNLQEVIDQQVLGASAISSASPAVIHTITHSTMPQMQKANVVQATRPPIISTKANASVDNAREIVFTPKRPIVSASTVKTPTTPATPVTPNTTGKEPIKIIRSNGRVITLPPIEAPTTRGAKRRAETTPSNDQSQHAQQQPQKQRIITVTVVKSDANAVQKTVTTTAAPSMERKSFGGQPTVSKPKEISARERRASVAVSRAAIDVRSKRSLSTSHTPATEAAVNDGDYDDEDDGSDGSYNSEDDPHRLWCICRQPHNNRFMICCDKCEEWFHGKCVGITKQMGTEMEGRGAEWICPNCIKKQQPSIKNIFPRKIGAENSVATAKATTKEAGSSSIVADTTTLSSQFLNCLVCSKPARANSIYCSDDCIRKHASASKISVTTSTVLTTTTTTTTSNANASASPKSVSESTPATTEKRMPKTTQPKLINQLKQRPIHPIVIYDSISGKYLFGRSLPTSMDKLQEWLHQHPSCSVVKPGTAQAAAFKAKQMQLKALAKNMEAEKDLFAVNQPPPKIQSTLRFDSEKKMVYANPSVSTKQSSASESRKSQPTTPNPTSTKTLPSSKVDSISKTPKLTATSQQKTNSSRKRPDDTKTPPSTSSSSAHSKSDNREQIRLNMRKTLAEQLLLRTKEQTDQKAPRLTEDEIEQFVKTTEAEMFSMFGNDTNNSKYRAKYRSLMFNIKDRKNQTLFQKISNKAIEPKQLVRLSPEELASQELAKWRENENKHQLEMITKSELDLLACGKSYVLKTHKGEEVIQTSGKSINLDPSIPVQDVVSVLNNATVSSSSEIIDDALNSTATTPIIVKDNRYDRYFSIDSSSGGGGGVHSKSLSSNSSKKESDRSRDKDRHSGKSSSSSKHKRKRSRDRHGHSHERSRDEHRDKSRDTNKDRDKNRDKDRKERSSGSDSKKSKKEHKSSSSSCSGRSKHHVHHDKDKKSKKDDNGKSMSVPKVPKNDENISIIDKILKAQSTIDSILHPEESKKAETETLINVDVVAAAVQSEEQPSKSSAFSRQPSIANESDQEPTSTVTIPTPPECSPEITSITPPLVEHSASNILWSGSISMVDVATFQVTISLISGSASHLEFAKELDVVGRISPDITWDYIDRIRQTKEIVLLRFAPQTDDDDSAYKTFISYLDCRRRLGVIRATSKMIKDFYILPLTAHKSLPSVLLSATGIDLESNRPDLLLGIIVKNRSIPQIKPSTGAVSATPKLQRPTSTFMKAHKLATTTSSLSHVKDVRYTPPSSPNMGHVQQKITLKPPLKSLSTDLEDGDEPYSPGGSDVDDIDLNTIPTSFLASAAASTNIVPSGSTTKPLVAAVSKSEQEIEIQREMEELNRQIEAEKMQIAMHLHTAAEIDQPYSPTNSVSPPITATLSNTVSTSSTNAGIPALANISIPANLADILKNIDILKSSNSTASTTSSFTTATPTSHQLISLNQYNTGVSSIDSTISNEYLPGLVPSTTMPSLNNYTTASIKDYNLSAHSSSSFSQKRAHEEPSKLAQLTDEELLRLVPDDSLLLAQPPPTKKSKYEREPRPPGIDDDDDEDVNGEEYKP